MNIASSNNAINAEKIRSIVSKTSVPVRINITRQRKAIGNGFRESRMNEDFVHISIATDNVCPVSGHTRRIFTGAGEAQPDVVSNTRMDINLIREGVSADYSPRPGH
jgi:hypothetical protein